MTDQTAELAQLTQSERATYQSLCARGYSHEDAHAAALDGVQVEDVRRLLRPGSAVES